MSTSIKSIDFSKVEVSEAYGYLSGAVVPRPIAFASTIDEKGHVNLSPFSFFNCFSANPPVIVFAPVRRVRNNTSKDTLDNILQVPETVVSIVSYAMVEQMSLASTEYAPEVDEFVKSGFTAVPAHKVRPPRVGESPAAFECVVKDVIHLGQAGGAGSLVVCEVVMAHIQESILGEGGAIDPFKLDAVARLGGNWYCRASGDALFEIPKPLRRKGIGVDQIPPKVSNSKVLTGNNLGRLGNVEALPTAEQVEATRQMPAVKSLIERFEGDGESFEKASHELAKSYLEAGDVTMAWTLLLL